jgi:hypothetical protein
MAHLGFFNVEGDARASIQAKESVLSNFLNYGVVALLKWEARKLFYSTLDASAASTEPMRKKSTTTPVATPTSIAKPPDASNQPEERASPYGCWESWPLDDIENAPEMVLKNVLRQELHTFRRKAQLLHAAQFNAAASIHEQTNDILIFWRSIAPEFLIYELLLQNFFLCVSHRHQFNAYFLSLVSSRPQCAIDYPQSCLMHLFAMHTPTKRYNKLVPQKRNADVSQEVSIYITCICI